MKANLIVWVNDSCTAISFIAVLNVKALLSLINPTVSLSLCRLI